MSIAMTRRIILCPLLLSAVVLAPGSVLADGAVPAAARMSLADNETFELPLPAVDNALPEYPQELLAHQLPPRAVCVRVSIDEEGSVESTALVGVGPDCSMAGTTEAAFYESAAAVASNWRFDPAFRCVFPKRAKKTPNGCYGDGVKEIPEAVSLVYSFEFEQSDGQGSVRVNRR